MVALLLLQVDGGIGGGIGQIPLFVPAGPHVGKAGAELILHGRRIPPGPPQVGAGPAQGLDLPLHILVQLLPGFLLLSSPGQADIVSLQVIPGPGNRLNQLTAHILQLGLGGGCDLQLLPIRRGEGRQFPPPGGALLSLHVLPPWVKMVPLGTK